MTANPGGGDHVPESPSEATTSNEHATIEALRAQVADYERRISWNTTCKTCAETYDLSISQTLRAEALEAEVEHWQDRAIAAEEDAARLSERLADLRGAFESRKRAVAVAEVEVERLRALLAERDSLRNRLDTRE